MSFKTYIIIILTVAITIILMQNINTEVVFKVLWMTFPVLNVIMMLIVTVFGFILGLIVGRPRKKKLVDSAVNGIPFEINQPADEAYLDTNPKNQLSDDDREYIS